MDNIIGSVEQYLNMQNPGYAIMINGSWGCGKTYFWKNSLEPLIEKTIIMDGLSDEKLSPVYISLFGVESVSEIDKKIALEVCDYLKFADTSTAKVIKGLGGELIAALDPSGILGKIFEGMDEIKIHYKKLANLKNKVICFDDLERAKIDIEEILGYINQLVEHENIKTIIIANEAEIESLSKKNIELKVACAIHSNPEERMAVDNIYKRANEIFDRGTRYNLIKEKVVGRTLFFEPKLEETCKNIIEESFEGTLKEFFLNNIAFICRVLAKTKNQNNLRVLKQALNEYRIVYEHIHGEERFSTELAIKILYSMIAVSFEFKTGMIRKEDVNRLGETSLRNWLMTRGIKDKNDKFEKSKADEFLERYYDLENSLILSKVLMEYIVNGYFDKVEFDSDMKRFIPAQKTNLQTFLDDYWELDDDAFQEMYQTILNEVKEGFYDYTGYPGLFSLMVRFSRKKVVTKSVEDIKAIFIAGAEKSYQSDEEKEKPNLYFELDTAKQDEKELYYYVDRLKKEKEKVAFKSELIQYIETPAKTLEFSVELERGKYAVEPVFKELDPDLFSNWIIKMNNEELALIESAFRQRYGSININDYLSEECMALQAISNKILNAVEEKEGSLNNYKKRNVAERLSEYAIKVCPGIERCKIRKEYERKKKEV